MKTIIFDDFETTKLPLWKEPSELPEQPHIVQVAAVMVDPGTRKILQSIDLIVKHHGWVSSPEALEVHGITAEMANDIGVEEHYAVALMIELCRNRKRVFYNKNFDNRIQRIGTKRYMPVDIQDEWKDGESDASHVAQFRDVSRHTRAKLRLEIPAGPGGHIGRGASP